MSVSRKDYTPAFLTHVRRQANVGLRMMADEVFRIADPKTPKRFGRLRQDRYAQVLGLTALLIWNKRYAAVQEDVQHQNYTTPGTGPHFAENGVREAVRRAEGIFKRARLV